MTEEARPFARAWSRLGIKLIISLVMGAQGIFVSKWIPRAFAANPDSMGLIIDIDVSSPQPVANLTASPGATEGSIDLNWTAPDEDVPPSGSAVSSYAVKIATFSIDSLGGDTTDWWDNWASILTMTGPGLPPGSPESLITGGLEPGVTFYFAIKSKDNVGYESPIDVNADTPGAQAYAVAYDTAPPAPENVSASSMSSTEIQLSWDPVVVPAFDLDFYRIYADSVAPYDFVSGTYTVTVDSDTTSYWDSGLTEGTTHWYYVTAVDKGAPIFAGAALESPDSDWVWAIPGIPAPTGLAGTALGVSSISWTWNEVTGADSYEVRLATDGVTSICTSVSTQCAETGLSPNVGYERVVVTEKGGGYSALSESATAYTLAAKPQSLAVTSVSTGSVSLTWNANGNSPITLYEVSMSLDDFGTDFSTPVAFADNLTSTYTTVGSLLPGTTYWFRVRAQNYDGFETGFSNVVSTTTLEVDFRIPLTPVVTPDCPFTYRRSYIHFSWEGGMPTSSGTVVEARYAVGTSTGAADVAEWKIIPVYKTDITAERLDLDDGTTYYISMKTLSSYDVWSDTGVSCGIIPDFVAPVVSSMTAIEELSYVSLEWAKAKVGVSGVKGYAAEYRRGDKPVWRNVKTGEMSPLSIEAAPSGVQPRDFTPAELMSSEFYVESDFPDGTYFFRVWVVNGAERVSNEPAYSNRLIVGGLPYDVITSVASYPNPFDSRRQSTVINYTLNQDAPVEIKIFDLFGGLVKKFESGAGQTGGQVGTNDVIWDGTDRKGRKVSKGMYLAVIQSGSSRVVLKIGVIH